MAGKKRTDNKERILRNGEIQRAKDNRYLYRYTDLSGKKRTVYAVTLIELREKEKQIERDLQESIDSSKGDMTLNRLFQIYMETKSDLRESTRHNYFAVWKNAIEKNAVNFALDNIVKSYNKLEYAQAGKEHREPELLSHISAHILRHTACTRLAESGFEPKVIPRKPLFYLLFINCSHNFSTHLLTVLTKCAIVIP